MEFPGKELVRKRSKEGWAGLWRRRIRWRGPVAGLDMGVVTLWVGLQLTILAAGALDIRFSENYYQLLNRAELTQLAVMQIGAAALLGPILFRNVWVSLAIIAINWPFLALGGVLSAASGWTVCEIGGTLTGWMAVMAGIILLVQNQYYQQLVAALMGASIIGGGVLTYLELEFAGASLAWRGPLLDIVLLVQKGWRDVMWWPMIISLLIIYSIVIIKKILGTDTMNSSSTSADSQVS